MKKYKIQNTIKAWAEDDRPREKMILKGKTSLSDAELLAIIMGSGSRDETAVDLAKRILQSVHHNWNELSRLSIDELCKFKGIGEAKAISIITALEIGKRRAAQQILTRPVVSSSRDAFLLLQPMLTDLNTEEFWVIYLNTRSQVLKIEQISKGGVNSTIVDIRIILKKAIDLLATGIILAHNHPSNNLTPSEIDLKLTQKVKEACKLLDIDVLEHIIVTQNDYFSFADKGLM